MPAPYSHNIYELSRGFTKILLQQLIEGDIEGQSYVPRNGACILAVNHASHIDPPFVGSQGRRQITFFARKTLWIGGIMSWWLDSVGAIPVDRDGDGDIGAMKKTLRTLKQGGYLSLFPEGTRSKDGNLQKAKPGIGLIAAKSQAIVVPCRLFGSHKVLSRESILPNLNLAVHLSYGKPLTPAEYDPGKEAGKARYQIVADRIMEAISNLSRPRPTVI